MRSIVNWRFPFMARKSATVGLFRVVVINIFWVLELNVITVLSPWSCIIFWKQKLPTNQSAEDKVEYAWTLGGASWLCSMP